MLNQIRVTLLSVGIVLLACSSLASMTARRWRGQWPARIRALGILGCLGGWTLFWLLPSFHGHLASPVLLVVAAAYPMIAVERGRGLPFRVFTWVALSTLLSGCATGLVLPLTWRNARLQESLLMLGVFAPPLAAAISLPAQRAYHGLRAWVATRLRGRPPCGWHEPRDRS